MKRGRLFSDQSGEKARSVKAEERGVGGEGRAAEQPKVGREPQGRRGRVTGAAAGRGAATVGPERLEGSQVETIVPAADPKADDGRVSGRQKTPGRG